MSSFASGSGSGRGDGFGNSGFTGKGNGPKRYERQRDPNQAAVWCDDCKQQGHFTMNCPLNTCTACCQTGHRLEACPCKYKILFQKKHPIFRLHRREGQKPGLQKHQRGEPKTGAGEPNIRSTGAAFCA